MYGKQGQYSCIFENLLYRKLILFNILIYYCKKPILIFRIFDIIKFVMFR